MRTEPHQRPALLLVDDDEVDRMAIRRALGNGGLDAELFEASDVDEALEQLRRRSFDCALLDHHLGGRSGLWILEQARAFGNRTPVVVVTAQEDAQTAAEIMKAGAVDYISKSRLSGERLVGTLRQVFRVHRAEERAREATAERETLLARLQELYASEQRAREAAEAATRAREDLVAIVSHDLKNPLSSIIASAALLERVPLSGEAAERVHRYGAAITRSAESMSRLIADLLDLASIESGRFVITREPCDIAALVRECVEILGPVASTKGLRLDWSASRNPIHARCEPQRVGQVLSNLLGNAIKFTPVGGHVHVHVERVDDALRVRVSDTGPGIAAQHLPHVFDRYWQLQRAHRAGVGLGLSIAKGLVEAHGGRIWVESPPGAGASFYFTLPDARLEAEFQRSAPPPSFSPSR